MNSNRAIMPTMMVSMALLEFFAEADVEAREEKEDD
jgi:hypothetical protein